MTIRVSTVEDTIPPIIGTAMRCISSGRYRGSTGPEAQAMIAELKGARLLQGFRGRPAADLEALEDTPVRVTYLAIHLEGHLAELDINPLMVLPSNQGV